VAAEHETVDERSDVAFRDSVGMSQPGTGTSAITAQ